MTRMHRKRRGAVLVWFALFLVVLFALSALVIDVGLVVLAKRQMQGSTESAAIAALKYHQGYPEYLGTPGNSRDFAEDLLAVHYHRDLNAQNTTTALGAGIEVTFDSGSGTPLEGTNLVASEGVQSIGLWQPRIDTATDIAFSPQSNPTSATVTLRRDGSSGHPTIPQIFSRGMLARDASGVSASSRAADGIILNVTGRAQFQPAMTAGVATTGPPRIVGLSRYGLSWDSFETASTVTVDNDSLLGASVFPASYSIGSPLELIGQPVDPTAGGRAYIALKHPVDDVVVALVPVSIVFNDDSVTFTLIGPPIANENVSAVFVLSSTSSVRPNRDSLKTATKFRKTNQARLNEIQLRLATPY